MLKFTKKSHFTTIKQKKPLIKYGILIHEFRNLGVQKSRNQGIQEFRTQKLQKKIQNEEIQIVRQIR